MSERIILEWEDSFFHGKLISSRSNNGKHWDIYMGGGTIDNPTYSLAVGEILVIQQDIPTLNDAKQMAQDIQDVLDGYQPVKRYSGVLRGTPVDSIDHGIEGVTAEDVDEFLK